MNFGLAPTSPAVWSSALAPAAVVGQQSDHISMAPRHCRALAVPLVTSVAVATPVAFNFATTPSRTRLDDPNQPDLQHVIKNLYWR